MLSFFPTLLLKSIQKFRLGSDFFRVSNIVRIGRCLSTSQVCNNSLRRIQVFWQYLAPHRFLGDWRGELICDDYGGYKACFEQGIAEVGCMAHARRKFFELHQSGKSLIAEQALKSIGQLYEIEAQATDLLPEKRQRLREQQARPIAEALHAWMTAHRLKVPHGTGIARALDYSLKRWAALTRYLNDGRLPIDNNWIENQIRPIALGRKNWLFAGSQRAGHRAATVMSLIQSAKMNGHDPYAYLKDTLTRLPTHPNNRIEELLPHRWQPDSTA